jgi:hypothetical protein
MKTHIISSLAAAALMAGTSFAHAQTDREQTRQFRQERQDQMQQRAQQRPQQDREWRREAMTPSARRGEEQLRSALQQAGFSDIRILDAAYLVQAQSPDGRQVTMFVDPPPRQMVERQRVPERQARVSPGFAPDDVDQRRPLDLREPSAEMDALGPDVRDAPFDERDELRAELERPHAAQRTRAFSDFEAEDQARARLRAQGMQNIGDLERHNENEFVATADWYGEEVDVHIDARTGEILQPQRLSETQIRNKLQEEGWEEVREMEQQENVIELIAEYEDEIFQLRLDPRDGRLLQWRDAG